MTIVFFIKFYKRAAKTKKRGVITYEKRWMVSLMAVAMAVSMAACGKSSGAAQKMQAAAPAGTTAAEAGASGETQTADAGEPVDGGY